MHTTYRDTALELMMDVMPSVKKLVDRIHQHDRNLADQIKRAASSVVLSHAEADGSEKGNYRLRVRTAYGSLFEMRKGLKLAAAWVYVAREDVDRVDSVLDRVGAMTYRRLHPRG